MSAGSSGMSSKSIVLGTGFGFGFGSGLVLVRWRWRYGGIPLFDDGHLKPSFFVRQLLNLRNDERGRTEERLSEQRSDERVLSFAVLWGDITVSLALLVAGSMLMANFATPSCLTKSMMWTTSHERRCDRTVDKSLHQVEISAPGGFGILDQAGEVALRWSLTIEKQLFAGIQRDGQ